jgi:hypothetical protein
MQPTARLALDIRHSTARIAIHRAGSAEPLLVQRADAGHRPFIHPLRTPDCLGVLTEDEPRHHPWQHGLYVGLNDVEGVGFWTEGRTGSAKDGTMHPRPLAAPTRDGADVQWEVVSDWRSPAGDPMLVEIQRWRLADRGERLVLDCEWSLRAERDLRFGKYPYGGFFLRMPYRKEAGGTVITSAGSSADQVRARWAAVSMPLPEGVSAGIAMLDHPTNPEHPTPWRIDGELGIGPARCASGEWRLARGEESVSRFRFLVHGGSGDAVAIESAWAEFAES